MIPNVHIHFSIKFDVLRRKQLMTPVSTKQFWPKGSKFMAIVNLPFL